MDFFMIRHATAGVLFAFALLVAGCGTPGAPQPPSLKLPRPVADLRAVRVGDRVWLAWTPPSLTTDGGPVSSASRPQICRSFSVASTPNCRVATDAAAFADDLSDILAYPQGHDFVNYTVEVFNDRGRSAGPSNVATVFLAAAVPRPAGLAASVTSDAVSLRWAPLPPLPAQRLPARSFLRVLRGPSAVALAVLAELPVSASAYADTAFDWERSYAYAVVGVTQVLSGEGKVLYEFQGEASDPALVTAHDTFPPAVPANVQAVYAGGLDPRQDYIDVTWSPGRERDLAGYIVYRSDGGAFVPVTPEPLKISSFRDDKIVAGRTYTYSVSAVDERGNESARSQPASEPVPRRP
jgi:hypothetical protein